MNQSPDDMATTSGLEGLSAPALLRLNYWCDQFESAWRDTPEVSLVEFLKRVPDEERSQLVVELILMDIEIRCQRALPISLDGYMGIAKKLSREWLEAQVSRRHLSLVATADELQPGQQLGDYTILGRIGAGGMGVVYRAEHRLMKRQVALKAIRNQNRFSQMAQRRFEREVRAAAQLAHPNIVVAYDARQVDDWIYLVTELIDGENLDSLVRRRGPLNKQQALSVVLQAARGLQYAHQQGIIHRDIKPANLIIDTQQCVKILDLGLARWSIDRGGEAVTQELLTSEFQLLGTAPFMSPEQMRAASSADQRSDIYSLGCTLFFMLTGQVPYQCQTPIDTCVAQLQAPVPSVRDVDPTIPAAFDELIMSWMNKDPEQRPTSMTEVVVQIEGLLNVKARPVVPPPQPTSSEFQPAQTSTFEPSRSVPPITEVQPKSVISRRGALLSTGGLAAFAVTAIGYYSCRARPGSLPSARRSTLLDSNAPGLRLQGDGFVDVSNFDVPVGGNMAIEVLLKPGINPGPANLVTWTGPKSFVLFCDESTRWGIAYFDGQVPRLIIADQAGDKINRHLVTAIWDGQQLTLQVDGQSVPSSSIPYELVPARPCLYIGGIPDGVILPSQGTRYYHGDIAAVRILQSDEKLQLARNAAQLAVSPQTVALFDFGPMQASSDDALQDLTGRWRGQMHWTER